MWSLLFNQKLYFRKRKMYFGFNFESLYAPALSVLVTETINFAGRKIAQKQQSQIGKINEKIVLRGSSPKVKYFKYGMIAFGSIVGLLSISAGIISGDFSLMSKGVGYGFGFAYFPSRLDQGNTLFIGTDGFMLRDMICKWSDFDRFEWDSDIGQKNWGVKFYKKNQKAYTKAYINRKHKDEINSILSKIFHDFHN